MQPDWAAGRLVGRYMVHQPIAAGGMATVHLGRLVGDGGFSRTVAIKRLHDAYASDPEFVAMLLDEARLASKIRHPNVVPTLDVVAENDQLLVVMEYVEGESLASLARSAYTAGESIPIPLAASIVAQALHGLHAAHECRDTSGEPLDIVHRDVSPQNVLVGTDGIARVLDFGIAKAASRATSTNDGRIKGKAAYMAPEQLQHGVVDRRTDVFAAAVVLWELLAGRRLFLGDTPAQTMARVLHEPIDSPTRWAPDVPMELALIALRGLERDPDARFATAEEMALAIEDAVALPRPKEIGAWVERVAAASIGRRAELVRALERATPLRMAQAASPELAAAIEEADRRRQLADLPTDVGARAPSSGHVTPPWVAVASTKTSTKTKAPAAPDVVAPLSGRGEELTDLATVQSSSAPVPTAPRRVSWLTVALAIAGGGAALTLAVFAGKLAMPDRDAPSNVAAPTPPAAVDFELPADPAPEPAPSSTEVASEPAPSSPAPRASAASSPPTRSTRSNAETKRRASPSQRAASAPDCRIPYVLDERGFKHFKVECL